MPTGPLTAHQNCLTEMTREYQAMQGLKESAFSRWVRSFLRVYSREQPSLLESSRLWLHFERLRDQCRKRLCCHPRRTPMRPGHQKSVHLDLANQVPFSCALPLVEKGSWDLNSKGSNNQKASTLENQDTSHVTKDGLFWLLSTVSENKNPARWDQHKDAPGASARHPRSSRTLGHQDASEPNALMMPWSAQVL